MRLVQGVQVLPFNSAELVGERPRNAAIATIGERRFLAYRHGPLGSTKAIQLAELGPQLEILSDRVLLDGDRSCEDPRLSLLNDRLWVSYHMAGEGRRSIGISEVLPDSDNPIGQTWDFPKFQPVEKNWVPMEWNGQSDFLISYDLGDSHLVKSIGADTGKVWANFQAAGSPAQVGPARGGTNFYPWARWAWLTIAHSSILTAKNRKLYVAFPVLVDNEPPYAVLKTGALLAAGSIYEGGYSNGMKKAVVFPCGLTEYPDGFLVSMGHNDKEVVLLNVPGDVIEFLLDRGVSSDPLGDLERHS